MPRYKKKSSKKTKNVEITLIILSLIVAFLAWIAPFEPVGHSLFSQKIPSPISQTNTTQESILDNPIITTTQEIFTDSPLQTQNIVIPTNNEMIPTKPLLQPTLIPCPGAPPTRLKVGDTGYVCLNTDELLSIRIGPSLTSSRISKLVANSIITIIGGPICSNNYTWWNVQLSSGNGWVVEGRFNPTEYFICPVNQE